MKPLKQLLIPSAIFISILVLGYIGLHYVSDQDSQKLDIKTQITAEQVGIRLHEFVNTRLTRLKYLRERMENEPFLDEAEFISRALLIQHELPGFQAINWIDENGIVQWVTPISSNLPVVGVDLIEKAAKGAAETFRRTMLFHIDTATPPIQLIQGGLGFTIYLPIAVDDQVSGFINGVFRLEELISKCFGNTVHDVNYEVIISGQRVFLRGEAKNFDQPLAIGRHNFTVLGRSWELQIVPGSSEGKTAKFMRALSLAVIFIIALLSATFTQSRIKSRSELTAAYKIVEDSEIKFRTIFDRSPACLFRFNQEKILTDWNLEAASLFGFEFPPKIRRVISDLDFMDPLKPAINKALSGEVSEYSGFIQIQARKVEVDAIIETQISRTDQIQGGIILLKDVTDVKQTLRAKEVMYEIGELSNRIKDLPKLFEAIQRSLSSTMDTRNFYVALYNPETNEFSYPYYSDEFDSAPPEPVKDERGLSAHVLREGVSCLYTKEEIYALNSEGEIDLLGTPSEQWLGSPLKVEGKPIGLMAVQTYSADIVFDERDKDMLNFVSDQIATSIKINIEDEKLRKSEIMHRELSAQLSDSNNIKALLLDIITHDLKNPAGVISGVADMLATEEDAGEEIKLIKDSSDALLKVIENTTSLARITLGEMISMEQINLSQLAENIALEFKPAFDGSGKPLEINIESDLNCIANPVIAEVFRNYLSNALKYSPVGKKVNFSLKDGGDVIECLVSDLGQKIQGKDQETIFQRTVQLVNGISRGSGLGLAIVKRIADVHNASVGVYSNEPMGNIFFIRLPKSISGESENKETERV
ncbi:GAF domain-containing protein [bacterium]|nr:GAF domain-containing protein [bacterium]